MPREPTGTITWNPAASCTTSAVPESIRLKVVFTVHEYKHAYSCRNTLATTILRMNLPHIQARTLNGRVYLVNTLIPRKTLTERKSRYYHRKRRSAKGEKLDE